MRRVGFDKRKLTLIIILILLCLLGLTITGYYFLNKKDKPTEHLVYDEFEMVGGKITNDTYYLLGASNDIFFEVIKENDFSYEVTDSDGNKVDSKLIDNQIKAPANLYTEGEKYRLKIDHGKFKDERYKDITTIIFKITRPAKQEMTLKENIIKANVNDLEITDKTIKSSKDFKENDIIVTYDNNKIMGIYEIVKVDNDTYQYQVPKLNNVFEDIDYYGKEKLNLAGFVNNKDFNLFLNSLVHTVYAKEDVTINKPVWNKKDGTLEVGINIYTSNKKEFLTNHDAKVELTLVLSIDLYKDISLNDYDYVLEINYDIKVKNNLNHSNDGFKNLYDAIKFKDSVENYDTNWLENDYKNITSDKKTISKSFGKISLDTEVPGLYAEVDLGVLLDMNSKGFINASMTGKNSLLIGISSKNGVYSSYTFDNKTELNFIGEEENKIGGSINAKVNFINYFNMTTKMSAGMYTNGKSAVSINKEDKKQTKIDYNVAGDGGFFAKYLFNTSQSDKEVTIYDDKVSLAKYEKKAKLSSKIKEEEKKEDEKEKEKEDEKPTYKYTKDEVKAMLQEGYDILDQDEEWMQVMGTLTTHLMGRKTIDIDNNTLTGTWTYDDSVSYSCTYNYLTKAMTCNNYNEALNYVKSTCDKVHNDYLQYLETGEIENEDAKEWDNLYTDMSACYYETITSSEPTSFEEDINLILEQTELTIDDLGVLEN